MTQADGQTTDAASESTAEADDAQTIDQALNEFEAETKPEPKAETPSTEDISSLVAELRTEREERAMDRMHKDIGEAVTKVKGELDIPESLLDDALWGKASKDQKFLNAFQQRNEKPEAWGKVLDAVRNDLSEKFKPKDTHVTDDISSAQAAARTSATQPDERPLDGKQLSGMSDAEFARLKEGLG